MFAEVGGGWLCTAWDIKEDPEDDKGDTSELLAPRTEVKWRPPPAGSVQEAAEVSLPLELKQPLSGSENCPAM